MNWTLIQHPRETIWSFPPLSRISFYCQTFSQIMEHHWQEADPNAPILFDSYWYRTWAKEALLNPDGVWLFEQLVARFPIPDFILSLNTSPEEALTRKCSISRFESYDGTRDTFVEFQRDMLELCQQKIPQDKTAELRQTTIDGLHQEISEIITLILEGDFPPISTAAT
jgi:thymidylate kinase